MGLDMYLYRKTTDEVAYWRKANAIHGWIINNTESEDNCTPIHLSKQLVIELRDACAEVLRVGTDEIAWELLPPSSGFFFGGNEVDEWYWENIKQTVTKLNEIIDNSVEDQEFEYHASW